MKDRTLYLRHIHDLLCRIKTYTAGGEAVFLRDTKTQDAVLHNLEIIGQCVKDYGVDDLKARHPDIPWTQIAAFRNVVAHQYLGVDIGLVWQIVERNLPVLEKQVVDIARELGLTLTAPPLN